MSGSNADVDDGTVKEALYPLTSYSASTRAIMDQTTKSNVQALREQIDQRVAQLESEIRALKTHRNTVADTSQLPPEILSNIFVVLRRINTSGLNNVPIMSWTRATRVCRHWRAVALDCPALWSDLVFVNLKPAITEMMLQRSKNAPLTFKFTTHPLQFHDILCEIASQTGRLRDVELRSLSHQALDLPKILSSFESAAPILERLVLEGSSPLLYGNKHHIFPDNFLQDGAPSLLHLEILRFVLPSRWDALPLSSTLTHLRVQNADATQAARPARKSFLECMATLVRLETLGLSSSLPVPEGISHPSDGSVVPITFPSLRNLELADVATNLRQLFNDIRIPRDARVDIKLNDSLDSFQSASFGPFFSALRGSRILSRGTELGTAGSFPPSNLLDLRIVEGRAPTDTQIKCWFQHHELPPTFKDDTPHASLVVSFRTFGSALVHAPLIKAIAEYLDISSLKTLKVATQEAMRDETLALFKNLSKLEKIAIWRNHETLSKVLKTFKEDGAPSFPALTSFDFHGIDFDDERMGDPDGAVRTLVTALELRDEYQPIEQIRMTECINFSEDHWESFRESLPEEVDMFWDQYEDMRESEYDEEEDELSELGWMPPGAYYDSDDEFEYYF